jgi:K+-sensing histidine kinase KdpD
MQKSRVIELTYSSIKISKLVEIAYAPFTEQFSQKEISVEFNMPYTLPAMYCDVPKIAWILTIFFSNAVRYTPNWGKLQVRGIATNEEIVVSVENSGYGIPLERLQRMFERHNNYESAEFGQGLAARQ